MGIEVDVYAGQTIITSVTIRNDGPSDIAQVWLRTPVRKTDGTWIGDGDLEWAKMTSGLARGASVTQKLYVKVPEDWGGGEQVEVRLDAAVLDSKGAISDIQTPWAGMVWVFDIPKPQLSWLKIVSAIPSIFD